MELKDFIGKVVVSAASGRRFILKEITAPEIGVVSVEPNAQGYRINYAYRTTNSDPFTDGILLFEDASLLEPFQAAYNAYCRTEDAYWEIYEYYMRRE